MTKPPPQTVSNFCFTDSVKQATKECADRYKRFVTAPQYYIKREGNHRSKMENVIAQIWSLIGLFTLLQNSLPPQLLQLLNRCLFLFQERFNTYYELDIPHFNGNYGANPNEVYEEVELYLASLDAIKGARRLTVFRAKESCSVNFSGDTTVGHKLVYFRWKRRKWETLYKTTTHLFKWAIIHNAGNVRCRCQRIQMNRLPKLSRM